MPTHRRALQIIIELRKFRLHGRYVGLLEVESGGLQSVQVWWKLH